MSCDYAEILKTGDRHPASAVPRLLAALKFHAPTAFGDVAAIIARMPSSAVASEADLWWETRDGEHLLMTIFAALESATPRSRPAPPLEASVGIEEIIACCRCGMLSSGDLAGRATWQMRSASALRVECVCPACAG